MLVTQARMAPMAAKKGSQKKATRRKVSARKQLEPRKAKRGLQGAELLLDLKAPDVAPLVDQVREVGGAAIGAYGPFLKKVDRFSDRTLPASLREREGWAARLVEIDSQVKRIIEELRETKPAVPIGAALTRMNASARRFEVGSVKPGDLALVAALSPGED